MTQHGSKKRATGASALHPADGFADTI